MNEARQQPHVEMLPCDQLSQWHDRSMSAALRPASVMARASLQHPAQAQTDPNKKDEEQQTI
jgi:hypothetical protein